MIALFALLAAFADELRPVRAGDTVESIAAARGDATLAAEIRKLNGLGPTEQPVIGSILQLPAPPGHHSDQEAFLIALNGQGTFTTNGVEVPADTWKPIPNQTVVCTGRNSTATLRLASTCNDTGDATDDIVMNPETCLTVQGSFSSVAGRSTVVQVTRGAVSVASTKDTDGQVTIVTPSGVTTGTGGYRVTIEEQAARTEAITAPVAVSGSGVEVAVGQGQGSRVRTGEVPMEPVDLLPPGILLKPEDGERLRRLLFTWQTAPEAFAYRLELSTNRTFSDVLYIEDLAETQYRPGLLLLPTNGPTRLHWRIAAFDRLGFLGMPSDTRTFLLPTSVLE